MEGNHKELGNLTMRHDVHESRDTCGSPPRSAAFQACQPSYARKKRCVTNPSHHECTYSFREGQRCVPKERPARPVRKFTPESSSEQSRPKYDLPLPRGIDHEVPRWSAMYSMFSEVLSLIPPDGYQNPMTDTRKRTISTEREQSPDQKSCSISNHISEPGTPVGDALCESIESSIMRHKTDATISFLDASSYMAPPITLREDIRSIPRSASAEMFFCELDALLRF